jgi:uncharacterized protein (DUF433 family)
MAQQPARIVRKIHDEPHIRGSRITVRLVYARVHGRGLLPETVAERHNLDIADVYHALAYYMLSRRNTTAFTPWIRAVTLGQQTTFRRLLRVSNETN